MRNKKTKIINEEIIITSLDIPHYNKNQILKFVCQYCGKSVQIKAINLNKKSELSCKSCAIKLHHSFDGKKISITKRKNPTPTHILREAQLNRSEEDKKKSIQKFQETMSKKDKTEMKRKISLSKKLMTDEQKKLRIEKYKKSLYENNKEKYEKHSELLLNQKHLEYKKIGDLLYQVTCSCGYKWIWTNYKHISEKYFSQSPYCYECRKRYFSKYEKEISDMITIPHINNHRKLLNGKELDIWIPSKNIGIEFDGVYWHNNSTKTLEKYYICNSKKIRLINIFEHEYQYDKIKSYLSTQLNQLPKIIIYARKCQIKEIDNNLYKNFCNENHLQNYSIASIRLGLFYNGELIQIMSFSKPQFNKKYQYEMIRECSKNYYSIVGGKEKLFKYFVKNYNPESIISYCDKRYFTGNSYRKLGFNQINDSNPSYFYTDRKNVLFKHQCQKHKLKSLLEKSDENLTEEENMSNNGYYKLYDFGQKIFIWKVNTNLKK